MHRFAASRTGRIIGKGTGMNQFSKVWPRLGVACAGVALCGAAMAMLCGCRPVDYAARFRSYVESKPPDQRPKDWAHTLELMERSAPQVGRVAPDFTLESYHGREALTRSAVQNGRPQVLIFGSYT